MRQTLLALAVLCAPVHLMAQAPAAASPAEALADAMAPFLATRQIPDDLTEADQRALALGRRQAADACQTMDASTFAARPALDLARLCLFGRQYEPARRAALQALRLAPVAEQWEAQRLLAEAFLGLNDPENAALRLHDAQPDAHFDPAFYRLMVRALDDGGLAPDRIMSWLCHAQLEHALAQLASGKALEDASDTVAPDQMMRDSYFSLALLRARGEEPDATWTTRLQEAAQRPSLRMLVGGKAMELPGRRAALAGQAVVPATISGMFFSAGKPPATRTLALHQGDHLLVSGALWLPGMDRQIAQLARITGTTPLLLVSDAQLPAAASRAEALQQVRALQKKMGLPVLLVAAETLTPLLVDIAPSALVLRGGKICLAGELRGAAAAENFRRALRGEKP